MRKFKTVFLVFMGIAFGSIAHASDQKIEPLLQGGIYSQEWFHESFMDLTEDVEEASEQNKRFVIMFEQKMLLNQTNKY